MAYDAQWLLVQYCSAVQHSHARLGHARGKLPTTLRHAVATRSFSNASRTCAAWQNRDVNNVTSHALGWLVTGMLTCGSSTWPCISTKKDTAPPSASLDD